MVVKKEVTIFRPVEELPHYGGQGITATGSFLCSAGNDLCTLAKEEISDGESTYIYSPVTSQKLSYNCGNNFIMKTNDIHQMLLKERWNKCQSKNMFLH